MASGMPQAQQVPGLMGRRHELRALDVRDVAAGMGVCNDARHHIKVGIEGLNNDLLSRVEMRVSGVVWKLKATTCRVVTRRMDERAFRQRIKPNARPGSVVERAQPQPFPEGNPRLLSLPARKWLPLNVDGAGQQLVVRSPQQERAAARLQSLRFAEAHVLSRAWYELRKEKGFTYARCSRCSAIRYRLGSSSMRGLDSVGNRPNRNRRSRPSDPYTARAGPALVRSDEPPRGRHR
jgi:hypothetical protein